MAPLNNSFETLAKVTRFTDFSLNLVRKTSDFGEKSNLVINLVEFDNILMLPIQKSVVTSSVKLNFCFFWGRVGSKGKSKGEMRFNFYGRKVTLIERHRYQGREIEGFLWTLCKINVLEHTKLHILNHQLVPNLLILA